MANNGHVYVGTGAVLMLTDQPAGITDAVAGSQFYLWGTFSAGSGNGFAQLNSIEAWSVGKALAVQIHSTFTYGEMINSATAFGVVDVSGPAVLDGTLDILLQTGYNPAVGTSFTFLLTNPGQLSGAYATILNQIFSGGTEKWLVSYNYGSGYAQLTATANNNPTPEPGTFLMLGSGLIGVAYTARRRFTK